MTTRAGSDVVDDEDDDDDGATLVVIVVVDVETIGRAGAAPTTGLWDAAVEQPANATRSAAEARIARRAIGPVHWRARQGASRRPAERVGP
jgi:hypothetical protein